MRNEERGRDAGENITLRLLRGYLRTYSCTVALCLIIPGIFATLHLLGLGGVSELGYALALTGAVLLYAFARSFARYSAVQMALWRAQEQLPPGEDAIPPARGALEESFRALAAAYLRELSQADMRADIAERERVDYYTLWVHQIKTPIAAMDLMAQSDEPMDRALLKQELFKVEQYAETALSYQRLQSLHGDMELTDVPLYPLCCAVARKLRPLFLYRHISLTLEPFEGSALSDAKWLGLVLTQVLTNALKYTPEQGSIIIRLRAPQVLEIADTGVGIRAEDIPRVFERGFTGKIGRDSEKSTGLGLYLCRETCKQLGHTITLESVPGKGTRVAVDMRRDAFEPFA